MGTGCRRSVWRLLPAIQHSLFDGSRATRSRPEFSFHYSKATCDFGWHHESNPHVDGWCQFQERSDSEEDYTYEPHTFTATNPTRIVWEGMATLTGPRFDT